jgi:UDP-N-acetyl-D-mannosaminuronic acid transferase (WecB/TagA/CpsF family)
MQKNRIEWLFRLGSEPKRLWKRYLIEGPKIFWLWAKWSFKNKKTKAR